MKPLANYLENWNLSDPRLLAQTPSSFVYKVKFESDEAILKLLTESGQRDEANGAVALRCYAGCGAVELLHADAHAHLLSFADGVELKTLSAAGRDAEATQVICEVLVKLHSHTGAIPSELRTVKEQFGALFASEVKNPNCARTAKAAELATQLLQLPSQSVILHGDIHHRNILASSARGWLSIDPKGLVGDRHYDFANVFFNPDDQPVLVEQTKRLEQLAATFANHFHLQAERVLQYAFCFGVLSAAWAVEDGLNPARRLRICALIETVLGI